MPIAPRMKGQTCVRCGRELYDQAPLVDHLLVEWDDGVTRVEAMYCAECAKAMADAIEAIHVEYGAAMRWYRA
jgi:hypothetical protein